MYNQTVPYIVHPNVPLSTSQGFRLSRILSAILKGPQKNKNVVMIQHKSSEASSYPLKAVGHTEECQVQAAAAAGRGGEETSNRT